MTREGRMRAVRCAEGQGARCLGAGIFKGKLKGGCASEGGPINSAAISEGLYDTTSRGAWGGAAVHRAAALD